MCKFKYNALALLNAALGVSVSVLLLIKFGATGDTDAFLLVVSIVAAINMLQLSFVEQFMHFYNDHKAKGDLGGEFYVRMLAFSLSVGIGFSLMLLYFDEIVLKLFVLRIDTIRYEAMDEIFGILLFSLLFYPANYINDKLLNSEWYFAVPYISEAIPFFAMILVLLSLFLDSNINISDVAKARLVGLVLGAIINGYIIFRVIGLRAKLNKRIQIWPCIKNSMYMRTAHNIHNFSVVPITNNILAALPEGYASLYYYALRIVTVVKSVAVGPSYKVYISKISQYFSHGSYENITGARKEYFSISIILFIGLSITVMIFLPSLFGIVETGVSVEDVDKLVLIYASLIFWQIAMVVESPFVGVLMASKISGVFYFVNIVFISLFGIGSYIFFDWLNIYSLPVSGFLAQIVSASLFFIFSKNILQRAID